MLLWWIAPVLLVAAWLLIVLLRRHTNAKRCVEVFLCLLVPVLRCLVLFGAPDVYGLMPLLCDFLDVASAVQWMRRR